MQLAGHTGQMPSYPVQQTGGPEQRPGHAVQRVVFVGPGRVGLAYALALQACGQAVLGACARNPSSASARQFAQFTSRPVVSLDDADAQGLITNSDVVFITTPDKAVTLIAQTMAENGWLHEGQIVVHTSGLLGSDVLLPVAKSGALRLSLHPLQTIANPQDGLSILRGAYCTLEGDEKAIEIASRWVTAWGSIPAVIPASLRPQYHAAAVLASNAVTALAAVAVSLSGLPEGLTAFLPLIRGAVDNLEKLGLPQALTGPIERGDAATVQAHMTALQHNPTARHVYAALGQVTANLALEKGTLSPDERQSFDQIFASALRDE